MQVKPGLEVPDDELTFSVARSGGPGGQNVNKVNSKVVLRFDLSATEAFSDVQKARLFKKIPPRFLTKEGQIVVHAETSRDQLKNKQACLEKLARVLRDGLARPKTRIPTRIGKGAKARRKADKQKQKRKKQERSRKDFD